MKEKEKMKEFVETCPVEKGCICDVGISQESMTRQSREQLEASWRLVFDQAYCICLQDRPDRLEQTAMELHNFGLCRLVKFYRCARPTVDECKKADIHWKGRFGCWRSHHRIAKLAVASDALWKRMAVFEDDVQFFADRITPERLRFLAHDMDRHLPSNWDVFKLGLLVFSSSPHVARCSSDKERRFQNDDGMNQTCADTTLWRWPRLWECYSANTHAMVWSRSGAERFSMDQHSYEASKVTARGTEYDFDRYLNGQFRQFACFPQLARQSTSATSNGNTQSPEKDKKNISDIRSDLPSVSNDANASLGERWDHFYRQIVIPKFAAFHAQHTNAFDVLGWFLLPLCIFFCVWVGLLLLSLVVRGVFAHYLAPILFGHRSPPMGFGPAHGQKSSV